MDKPIEPTHTLGSLPNPPSPSTLCAPELQAREDLLSTAPTAALSRLSANSRILFTALGGQLPLIGYPQGAQRRRWPGRTPLPWGATEELPAAAGTEAVTEVSHKGRSTRYKVRWKASNGF